MNLESVVEPVFDFHLELLPSGTGYRVGWECKPLAGEGDSGEAGLSADAAARFQECGAALANGALCQQEEAWHAGRALFDAVFGTPDAPVRAAYRRSRDQLRAHRGAQLRVLLSYDHSPQLHEIPWELLHDGEAFLAVRRDTLLVRYLRQGRRVKPLPVRPPLRLLFTAACPPPRDRLALDEERREVEAAVAEGRLASAVRLDVRSQVGLQQLKGALVRAETRQQPFHVWHHCGHGGTVDDGRQFLLVLERDGEEECVPLERLAEMVAGCEGLRLVFLNVCHGGVGAGLATALAGLNVPAVIGHRTSITDRDALTFARGLYRYVFCAPLDVAVREARCDLYARGRRVDWALPLLFLRTTDALLLGDAAPAPPAGEAPRESGTTVVVRARGPVVIEVPGS